MSRVLIVEDETYVRHIYRRVLTRAGHEVTEAASVTEARALLADGARRFDVVLLDLCLLDGSGASLIPVVRGLSPPPAVAVVSSHLDAEAAVRLQGRAVLVVPKENAPRVLADVVRELAQPDEAALVDPFAEEVGLSDREAEVLRLACARVPNKHIPDRMGCSAGTLRRYWLRIYAKTGTDSRDDAVATVMQFSGRRRVTPPRGHPRVR